MLPATGLKDLQSRKQELLEESAEQRGLLHNEWRRIEAQIDWIDRSLATARRFLPLAAAVLPMLKLWRSRRDAGGGITRLLPLARHFLSIWQKFRRQ